jgi:predicted phage terminase large subunit-like protein
LLSEQERAKVLNDLTEDQALDLLYNWEFWARPNQLPPPGKWMVWLLLAGRGFGKTRTGAEYVRMKVERGEAKRIALVAPTAADARDVVVEGDSGLLAISDPRFKPIYEPSKRRITWPNGAIATLYSADEPERLRGPQHDLAWCDELCAWKYPEAWDMLKFGLRLGSDPRVVVTTTPKPTNLIRELAKSPDTHLTKGTTYDNSANLAATFIKDIKDKYEGTRLGRQELYAEILDDVPGALWNRKMLDDLRVKKDAVPEIIRMVVAIDPAVTSGENADETGIIVAGKGADGKGYVFDDFTLQDSPERWARQAIEAYRKYKADRIIAEVNQGGEMVEYTLRMVDPNIPYKAVRASKGKRTRAEPVAALYEQGKVHHVGLFPELEDQMCLYTPDGYEGSPDRVDALVWALTELIVDESPINIYI